MRLRRGCQAASRSRFQHGGEGPGLPRRLGDLLECALPRSFVGTKAEKLGAMAKAVAGDLVIIQRLPFGCALGAPAALAPRHFSCETRRGNQSLEPCSQPGAILLAIVEVKPT